MTDWGWKMTCVYVLDSQFITDGPSTSPVVCRRRARCYTSVAAVSVLSKVDMLEDKSVIDPYLTPDHSALADELDERMDPKYRKLNRAIAGIMGDFALISRPDGHSDEDSLQFVLYQVDNAIGYGEDADVRRSRRRIR